MSAAYEDYVEKRIFEPLGMTRSMYCNNSENVPRRAYGHGLRNRIKPFVRVIPIVHGDLRRRRDLLDSGGPDHVAAGAARRQAASPKSYVEMITPWTRDDGTPLLYSMGLFVGEDSRGLRFIGHDGGGFGFSPQTRWYRDAQLAVVLLTNSEPDDTTPLHSDAAVEGSMELQIGTDTCR